MAVVMMGDEMHYVVTQSEEAVNCFWFEIGL